jgi:hypothetical protein
MKFDSGSLLWAMGSLADMGHPDPEGLIARIEASKDDGNISGISKEDATKVGIRSIDEPVMSMFAAATFDTKHNKSYQVSDERRAAISARVNDALFAGTSPSNPFLDSEGFLIAGHKTKTFNEPNDKKLLDTIYNVMDEVL